MSSNHLMGALTVLIDSKYRNIFIIKKSLNRYKNLPGCQNVGEKTQ